MTVIKERHPADVDGGGPADSSAADPRWPLRLNSLPQRLGGFPGWLGSVPGWLGEVVFRPPAVPQRPTRRAILGYLFWFVAASGYLLVIPAGRSHLTRIWGEDGVIFLQDALRGGVLTPVFTPYAGYLHLLPRLCAELLSYLPISWWAAGLAVAAALVRAAMAIGVYAATNGHLRSPVLRFVLAAAVIVLPAGNNEALDTLANLHWFTLFAAFWLLLWRPTNRWQSAVAALGSLLYVLTSPIGVLLSPLAAARLTLPRRRDRVPAIAFFVGLAADLVPIFTASRPHSPFDLPAAAAAAAARGPLVTFTGSELAARFYPRVAGVDQHDHLYAWPAALAAVAVLALAAIAIVRGSTSRRLLTIASLLLGSAIIVLSLHSNWTSLLRIDQAGVVLAVQRYSAGPCLFFLTAIVLGLAERPRPPWRYVAVAARVAVAAVIATGVAYQWSSDAALLKGITWSQAMAAARRECAAGRAGTAGGTGGTGSAGGPGGTGGTEVKIRTIPESRTFIPVPCSRLK
jgi:hypothetical protein